MMTVSRRAAIGMTAASAALALGVRNIANAAPAQGVESLTRNAQPIAKEEHAARLARLQSLMQQQKVAALLVEAGSSLEYFTGIRWWRSERTTAALIPVTGKTVVVTPFFEVPSVDETLRIDADIRPWHEDQDPFSLVAEAVRAGKAPGPLAIEPTTRHFIVDNVARALGSSREVVSGESFVNACRMIKSPTELALMQAANDVTINAIRRVRANVKSGMTSADIMTMLVQATNSFGGEHEFSLVLLNEASAYPHGSAHPQAVREGSVVLVDSGCKVHGYSSDISRTWVSGTPTPRQREVWDTVKRGQEIALETVKVGVPVGEVDNTVRAYYEGRGWATNYGLPGTSHRTGHGIGMDGHEPPNLMRADRTPFEVGMCFSDEPGIYIPGEFGVRMEDCWYLADSGPKLFTPLAKSIDDPV
jgi:Xaa-Pro dipeptidase